MFELGFTEVLLVLIIALVVIGPERLPEVARGLGSMVGRVRTFIDNVKNESSLQKEIADLRRQLDVSKEVNDLRNIGTQLQTSLTATEAEVRSSFYDRPSTDSIRQDFRDQQEQGQPQQGQPQQGQPQEASTKHDADDLDLAKVQRPTFGREQYEELPPWYHERSDGALAPRAPSVPERPSAGSATTDVPAENTTSVNAERHDPLPKSV